MAWANSHRETEFSHKTIIEFVNSNSGDLTLHLLMIVKSREIGWTIMKENKGQVSNIWDLQFSMMIGFKDG